MSLFDGDFDAEDAAILGGIAGFAEESMREEDRKPEDNEDYDSIVVDLENPKEINLRLIRNMNPELFRYVVSLVAKHNKKWRQQRLAREAIQDELKAMAETEELMKNLDEDPDEI